MAWRCILDDATVEIENIHRNMGLRKTLLQSILDGAQQIAVPAFVATLSICIVFVPVFFITGAARFLFEPLALAVIFAMLASYVLSRTLVPTMARYLLGPELAIYASHEHVSGRGPVWAVHRAFNHVFEAIGRWYTGALQWTLAHRWTTVGGFAAILALAVAQRAGRQDFFLGGHRPAGGLHVQFPLARVWKPRNSASTRCRTPSARSSAQKSWASCWTASACQRVA